MNDAQVVLEPPTPTPLETMVADKVNAAVETQERITIEQAMRQLDTAERMLIMRDEVDEAQALDFIRLARQVHELSQTKRMQTVSKKDRRAILELAAKYILVLGRELLERRVKEANAIQRVEQQREEARQAEAQAALTRGAPASELCATCQQPVGALAVVREGRVYCTTHAGMV